MKRLISTIISFFAVCTIQAQTGLEMYGFGLPQDGYDAVGQGMGGISVVPAGGKEYFSSSVASWHRVDLTRLNSVVDFSYGQIGNQNSFRVIPQELQVIFHATRTKAWGVTIRPRTRTNVVMRDISRTVIIGDSTITYNHYRQIKGGVSSLGIGYSRRLAGVVSFGAELNFMFGTIVRRDSLIFTDISARPDFPTFMESSMMNEFVGTSLELSTLIGAFPKNRSELGIHLNIPMNLRVKEVQYVRDLYSNELREIQRRNSPEISLPYSIDIGYRFDLNAQQQLSIEYDYLRHDIGASGDRIFPEYLRKITAYRAGWARAATTRELFILGRIDYRVGIYNKAYYISANQSAPISEFGVSVGFGYTSRRFGHGVDLALTAGRRDSPLTGYETEDFYRLTVGLSSGELWFRRAKKEWD